VPALKSDQLESSIRSGKIGRLYVFDGPENWLKERALNQILAKLVPPESKDFNLERFDGRSCSGGEIVSAAQSLPFLGDRRVVIVQAADELSAADSRIVGESLAGVPDSSCVIFFYDGKANLREEIPAQVGSLGSIVTFWTPFPNQLPSWVTSEAKLRGKTMTMDAAMMIAESCSDLQQISNELDKICLFVGEKKAIDGADVRSHGLPDEVGDTRELEEALWGRNAGAALTQARLLAEVGVRGEAIFPICARVFRMLILGQSYLNEKKMSAEDIYSALNLRGKTQQGNFAKGMRAYRPVETRQSLEKITQADYDLKTGTLPSDVAVSLLIWNLCGTRAQA
jgi:DNA polymerase III subunit delta